MPVYTYTTFDDPLNTSGDGTLASGINDTGHIVGTYADASGVHGFLLSGGSYTTLDEPLAQHYTTASGINGTGQVLASGQNFCGQLGLGNYDIAKIDVIGEKIAAVQRKYQMHQDIERELQWMGDMKDLPPKLG